MKSTEVCTCKSHPRSRCVVHHNDLPVKRLNDPWVFEDDTQPETSPPIKTFVMNHTLKWSLGLVLSVGLMVFFPYVPIPDSFKILMFLLGMCLTTLCVGELMDGHNKKRDD